MICLVNEHQHDFNKLIADIQKRQQAKRNKSATKTSGQWDICFCFMNWVCCMYSSEYFKSILYVTLNPLFVILESKVVCAL